MIAVVVRDDEVVDAGHARLLRGGGDAIRVASLEPRVARVDQHRLARRRDDERRLSAFDVDEIDVERLSRLGCAGNTRQQDEKQADEMLYAFHAPSNRLTSTSWPM